MLNLVVILPMMSDSKWPTGSHFDLTFSTLLLGTPKPIEIETSLIERRVLGYIESTGDIADYVRFKMAEFLVNIFTSSYLRSIFHDI